MEKFSGVKKVVLENASTVTRERCRAWIGEIAGPRIWAGNERWLGIAAERSGLSFRKVKSLYYGEITDKEHPAVKALQETAVRYEAQNLADQVDALARRVRDLGLAEGIDPHARKRRAT